MAMQSINRVRTLRTGGVKLTQEELAKLVGIDSTTVARHEAGSRGLSSEMIDMYARVFKCPTHELFIDPVNLPTEDEDGD